MLSIFKKLNKNYGLELTFLSLLQDFNEGVVFFNFAINWDKYEDDHTPSFAITLIILNWVVFDFLIYYLHHRRKNETIL